MGNSGSQSVSNASTHPSQEQRTYRAARKPDQNSSLSGESPSARLNRFNATTSALSTANRSTDRNIPNKPRTCAHGDWSLHKRLRKGSRRRMTPAGQGCLEVWRRKRQFRRGVIATGAPSALRQAFDGDVRSCGPENPGGRKQAFCRPTHHENCLKL